jgi:hypothetical protein
MHGLLVGSHLVGVISGGWGCQLMEEIRWDSLFQLGADD